ncbi:MAG: hypothetical protein CL693_08350 [Cellvibrionaceae bacterium]|nr:hypothetical protein [Cellvibrionaceae bacterium]|tara:strand:+ start:5203 stop:6351 length:1149 start_codon:yes stop_codon:yes gene_type:complete
MFDATVLAVISVNLFILLIVTWGVLALFIRSLSKDKLRLSDLLEQAIKNYKELKALLEKDQIVNRIPDKGDDALGGFIEDIEKTSATLDQLQQSRSEQLESLDKIESVANALKEDEQVRALKCELATLKAQIVHSEDVMVTMKTQATASRHRLSVLEEKLENTQHFPQRISSLEDLQRKLRGSNKQLMEKLEESRLKVKALNHAKSENTKLKSTLDNYIEKSKNGERLINNLQDKLSEVQGMLDETRATIDKFSEQPAINMEEAEVAEIKDALSRALREKQFIEEQYLELLDKVEEAGDVTEQLQRSQNECAMLEQSYLTLMSEIEQHDASAQESASHPHAEKSSDEPVLTMSDMDAFDEESDSLDEKDNNGSDDDFKLEQI